VCHQQLRREKPETADRAGRPLEDSVAIVTGAATGIGLAIAKVLSDRGARFVLNDIDANGSRLRPQSSVKPRPRAWWPPTSPTRLVWTVLAAEALKGSVDILVSNARGSYFRRTSSATPPQNGTDHQYQPARPVPLHAPVVPGMISAERGSIVNISSIFAVHVHPALPLRRLQGRGDLSDP